MDNFGDAYDQQPRLLFVDSGHARPCASILKSSDQCIALRAADGRAALDILRNQDIDVIVIDEEMPDMAAPYLIAATQELSPTTAAIVLTKSADKRPHPSERMIRTVIASCSEQELRAHVEALLAELQSDNFDPAEALADELLSQDLSDTARSYAAELHPDFARTMTEHELASTDILDSDTELAASVIGLPQQRAAAAGSTSGVIVFTADPDVIRCIADAAQDRFPLYVASNIVQVVKLLQQHAPGVLITDIAEDRNTIAAMTGRLKYHVPRLVTIVVSARRDPAEMAWLINHGHIFRFLRKPLSHGRCAVCLEAAMQHYEALQSLPQSEGVTVAERSDDSGIFSGVFEKLKAVSDRFA